MSKVGQRELLTQQRAIKFFAEKLGYRYLGNWHDRENANVEPELLLPWLKKRGYPEKVFGKVQQAIAKARAVGAGKSLYEANREMYGLLRYGVKVKDEAGEQFETVWLIDWKHPEKNDFAVAEEVAVAGHNDKRPDIVLYVNGIALGVLELKRSVVSVAEGIRQNLDNQKKNFIRPFFATVQLVMAGNETEGLRYGVIETREKHYMHWKEPSDVQNLLHRGLAHLCRKDRFLELIHDFMVFDAGTKKTCRHNQYFGVKAAQERVRRREGGIIWHTQGSGKSLTMVWLAKWIREHVSDSRVLIITDRTELDEQIEKVFLGVKEDIYRTKSGDDLVAALNKNEKPLMASLVHKFGASEEGDIDAFLADIERHLPKGFRAKGEFFVFVDECHRTQSGKLHDAVKALLPGAMFIGFTGTPLLKNDKKTSIETFGRYIHTYKYDEAVADKVVLDLRYEAREIDQELTSPEKIDQWFEAKTKGLTDVAKAQLKQRWGTMRKVLSSQDRLQKIVADVLFDMETRDRLRSGHGNAMLVCDSIYSACRIYEMFQKTDLASRCAIITSYKPSPGDIKGEETGEGLTEALRQYDIYRKMLANHFDEPEDAAASRVDDFEKDVKKKFIEEPGQMKLLIVVDKLLTGFDAPPATYLYIDKKMRDHGLFQAICRVNRLDSEDKEYGYIIDYKDLFGSLKESMHDYTGGAFEGYDKKDIDGLLKDRLGAARQDLDDRLEAIRALCEPVEPPQGTQEYLHYFCSPDPADKDALKDNEAKRVTLYKLTSALLRAYSNLANEMDRAGYSTAQAASIKADVGHYEKVRQEVKLASGDYIDMKAYEPAMRHLLDTYIRAEESKKLSAFNDMTLVQLVVQQGPKALDQLPEGIRKDHDAMAETIENNVRKVIIDEMALNPKYYAKMSELLDALIQARRQEALTYQAYLAKIVALAKQVGSPDATEYPPTIITPGQRALFDNLDKNETLALAIHHAILEARHHGWRDNRFKERALRAVIKQAIESSEDVGKDVIEGMVNAIFEIVKGHHEY